MELQQEAVAFYRNNFGRPVVEGSQHEFRGRYENYLSEARAEVGLNKLPAPQVAGRMILQPPQAP